MKWGRDGERGGPEKKRRGDLALLTKCFWPSFCARGPRPWEPLGTWARASARAHLRLTSTGRDLFDSCLDSEGATAADQLRAGQCRESGGNRGRDGRKDTGAEEAEKGGRNDDRGGEWGEKERWLVGDTGGVCLVLVYFKNTVGNKANKHCGKLEDIDSLNVGRHIWTHAISNNSKQRIKTALEENDNMIITHLRKWW